MENEELRATNVHLCQQQVSMECRIANQDALLACFGQAFDRTREGIVTVLRDWEDCSPDPGHGES